MRTTDLGLRQEQGDTPRHAGYTAAALFFETWNFQAWTRKYRSAEIPPSQEEGSVVSALP